MSPVLLICFFGLAIFGHGFLWMDLVNRIHAWSGPRKIVDGVTYMSMLAFVIIPLVVLTSWSEVSSSLMTNAPFRLLSLKSYLLLCAGWGTAKLAICFGYRLAADRPSTLQEWKQEKTDLAPQLGEDQLHGTFANVLSKVPGNQILTLSIDRKRLAIAGLPRDLEGLRIAHISDLHMTGRIGAQWYEVVMDRVNQLNADLIAVTGDIVENEACLPWLASTLGKLRAKHGVYFIFGNHDFYVDTTQTKKLLEGEGLVCLSGSTIETAWNGVPVLLAGNEQPWGDAPAQLPSATDETFTLLLMHTPDEFAWACQHRAHLALAGHTHGGQLRFPLLGPIACPSRFGTRYACGVFRSQGTVMHVTRGLSGETPLRWNCPPEIALLELVRT